MGVLKVNVGDDASPSWRKIGCGAADLDGSTLSPPQYYSSDTGPFTFSPSLDYSTQTSGTDTYSVSGPLVNGHYYILSAHTASGAQITYSGNYSQASGGTAPAVGVHMSGGESNIGQYQLKGAASGSPVSTIAIFNKGPAPPGPGRFKLREGSVWLRETCDGESGNLLTSNQSSLEAGTTAGWVAEGQYTGLTTSTTHTHSGAYSLLPTVSAAIDRYWATPGGTSGFPVIAGLDYTVSAWVWREDISNQSSTMASLRWYNAAGSLISTSVGPTQSGTRNQWNQHIWGPFKAPVGAKFGALAMNTSGANNLFIYHWVDDVAVKSSVVGRPLKLNIGTPSSPVWVKVACMVVVNLPTGPTRVTRSPLNAVVRQNTMARVTRMPVNVVTEQKTTTRVTGAPVNVVTTQTTATRVTRIPINVVIRN